VWWWLYGLSRRIGWHGSSFGRSLLFTINEFDTFQEVVNEDVGNRCGLTEFALIILVKYYIQG
jgi:hypothetical protein